MNNLKPDVRALNVLKPDVRQLSFIDKILEYQLSEEAKNEIDKIKEIEKLVNRRNSVYKIDNHTYSFQQFKTITFFAKNIFNGEITLNDTDEYQSNLLVEIMNFNKKIRPRK